LAVAFDSIGCVEC